MERAARKQSFNADCTVQNQTYTLYTCPPNTRAEVVFLLICNHTSSTNVDVYWNDLNPPNVLNLIAGKNLAANETLIYNSGFSLILEAGDKIQVKPSSNPTPHIDALCTVLETFVPI